MKPVFSVNSMKYVFELHQSQILRKRVNFVELFENSKDAHREFVTNVFWTSSLVIDWRQFFCPLYYGSFVVKLQITSEIRLIGTLARWGESEKSPTNVFLYINYPVFSGQSDNGGGDKQSYVSPSSGLTTALVFISK